MLSHSQFILDQFSPVSIYMKIEKLFPDEVTLFFESAEVSSEANYSFITVGSLERLQYKNSETLYTQYSSTQKIAQNPFEFLKGYYSSLDRDSYLQKSKELGVGFIDGFIGYIGYESIEIFEPTMKPYIAKLENEIDIPDIDLVRPELILAYSHRDSKMTLISSDSKMSRRFDEIESFIKESYEFQPLQKVESLEDGFFTHSKSEFFEMVRESKKMIRSGDVFQILISNRYREQLGNIDPFSFYRLLRSKNPSPYMFFMNYGDFHIVGSSPEVMVRLTEGEILLRPIAGTRKRGNSAKRDKELQNEMLNDPKERAEHLMLIDLGRNDVGRVAKSGTVKVPNIMRVEKYSHVMHMVTDINAEIDERFDMFDLLGATFTAGTMTGAPKIRAMELISEYEGVKRNFYSGTVALFGFDGNMDSAITIRTALIKDKKIFLQAGAGVVADSIEELEYLEIQNKMNALLATLKELKEL